MSTLQVTEVVVGEHTLSITTRDNGDDPAILQDLTARTIGAWLWIVHNVLWADEPKAVPDGSVEDRYLAERNAQINNPDEQIGLIDSWGDPRVTIWDTYRSAQRAQFRLTSDDNMTVAVDVWRAQHNGVAAALQAFNPKQSTAPSAPRSAPPGTNTPPAPPAAQGGVIVATRAPTPSRPQYADGQLVQFTVNKIVMGTNKGSVTYALWGALGVKYPLMTIYKTKSGSDENSLNYINAKDTLVALGLSVDAGKIEATGTWTLLAKISHDGGKEYTHVVSLTAG